MTTITDLDIKRSWPTSEPVVAVIVVVFVIFRRRVRGVACPDGEEYHVGAALAWRRL